ncbi:MAG: thioesterase family protein [Pseudobacteriovorax sp.]|nr:thioesterase family protein [Pseudobacteriovorax sp.]
MENTLVNESLYLKGRHEVPIYYEDTDLSGFVYHANYLKYFERAREHIIGMKYLQDLWRDGIHFVIADADLKFLKPATQGDIVIIDSKITYSRSPVLNCFHEGFIERDNQRQKIVSGTLRMVTLNRDNRPVRLPDAVIEYFGAHC